MLVKSRQRVAIYSRVSTIDQTTANQERELREVASRMGCELVKVYRDHGISGAKGRDERPQFRSLVPGRHETRVRRDYGLECRAPRPVFAGPREILV